MWPVGPLDLLQTPGFTACWCLVRHRTYGDLPELLNLSVVVMKCDRRTQTHCVSWGWTKIMCLKDLEHCKCVQDMTARQREPQSQSQYCITLYLHGYVCLVLLHFSLAYSLILWLQTAHVLLQLEYAPFMPQYCHHYDAREVWRSGKVIRLCPYGWIDALCKGCRKWAQALSVLPSLLLGKDTTAQAHLGGFCKKAWLIKVKDFGRQWISSTQTLNFLTFRTLRNRISVIHKLFNLCFYSSRTNGLR